MKNIMTKFIARAINKGKQLYIGFKQFKKLQHEFSAVNDYIVFLIPGYEIRSGGILSIFSFYRETKKIFGSRKAVIMSSYPGQPKIENYTWFNNDVYIYSFDEIVKLHNVNSMLIHVPEYYVEQLVDNIESNDGKYFKYISNMSINIMNQNIEYMPKQSVVNKLKKYFSKLTITNAHQKYTTIENRALYNAPMHLLASWYDQEPIAVLPYESKRDKVIVSPDQHSQKSFVLKLIKDNFPNLELIVINNFRYDDFKQLEKEAKWGISFGEGLDGYFAGLVLRGGIGFAVYNEEFFTKDYKVLPTVSDSYTVFGDDIVKFIKENDAKESYESNNRLMFDIINAQFNYEDYINNVKMYYEGSYTFP
jgi:hypothetical protein